MKFFNIISGSDDIELELSSASMVLEEIRLNLNSVLLAGC